MKDIHKAVRRLVAVTVGLVFFTAGMLKLMDPVGATLVVKEYFTFFHTGWLSATAGFAAVAMALLETLTGAALLAGVWRKWVALVTTVLVGFFTLITLILLVTKAEMDCGCFGEAIHLSTTATFLKNVVLCVFCAIAFLPARDFSPTRRGKLAVFAMSVVVVTGFTVYELGHLPLIDFTEFAPGASFVSESSDGEKAADSREEIFVIYEKDGKEGVFSLDRLPDSTWTFVRVRELERTYADYESGSPSISLADAEGNYHDQLLAEGNIMVLSIHNAAGFRQEDLASAAGFLEAAEAVGFRTVVIARERIEALPEVYTSDYKKVITLNRSNGGATWISDGEIIAKWPAGKRPDAEELQSLMNKNEMEYMVKRNSRGRIWFQGIMLYSLAILLLA